MKISDAKLKQIISLLNLLNGEDIPCDKECPRGDIKIVILQRGWVFIGRYYQDGPHCELRSAYCIRRWGTTEGLGQLAREGKQSDTILEKTPIVKFHELTVVATIDCEESKWKSLI